MIALKSVQRAIGLLEHDNPALALDALRDAVTALEHARNGSAAIDAFVAAVVRTKPWTGLSDHTPAELEVAKRTALDVGVPLREVPLDNYSHSVVCLVGFDTGEDDFRPAPEMQGDGDAVTHKPAQVLVEVLNLKDELTQQGLPTPGASIVVRDDQGHPSGFQFTLDTPDKADAAVAALQGARELAFGPPPAGVVVSRS